MKSHITKDFLLFRVCLRRKGDKVVTALGVLFIILCIVGIAGIIYVLASKDHFEDKEA